MKTISGTQSDILDDYFQNSFAESRAGIELNLIDNPYAIIAKGNYGRKEIYGQNDINILFLFSTYIPEKANGLIRDIIYPLWDLGLKINYSTRTVEECIKYAKKDYEYLLSVLDSRFVCGASLLFSQLITSIREKIVFNHKKEITAWQCEQDKLRHQKYNTNQFILEPDLVFSKGGLKDYHSIFSIAKLNLNIIELSEITSSKLLLPEEYEILKISTEYIRKVIIFLNITSNRNSRLLVKHQQAAATFMKYKKIGKKNPVDIFLSDLYGHMNNTRKIHNQFFLSISPKSFALKKNNNHQEPIKSEWLFSIKGLLSFKSPKKIIEKPERLLYIFNKSEKLNIALNSQALRLISKHSYLLRDSSVDNNPHDHGSQQSIKVPPPRLNGLVNLHIKVAKLFEKNLFLSEPESAIPFQMLDSGILTTLIPEFSFAVNKKKAGVYYIHPLCHHLLLTLKKLKKLLKENNELQKGVFQINESIEDHLPLLWAGLLHNIRQELVGKILKRFGKSYEFIEEVCFLTKNHNFLYDIISRKNICNLQTIKLCSAKFNTFPELNKLYFLTIADMKATGPLAFNDYKIKDLTKLYQRTLEFRFVKNIQSYSLKAKTDYLLQICNFHKMEKTQINDISFFSKQTDKIKTITILSKAPYCLLAEIITVFLENKINIYDYRSYSINGKISVFIFRTEKHRDNIFEIERWAKIKKKLYRYSSGKSRLSYNTPANRKGTTNHGKGDKNNDDSDKTQSAKIKITSLNNCESYLIEFIAKNSLKIMFKVINILILKNFEIIFFRKTEVSYGCLFVFNIIDHQKELIFSKAKKKLSIEISKLIDN